MLSLITVAAITLTLVSYTGALVGLTVLMVSADY